MKTPLLFVALFICVCATAQITTPVIKAGFGVDADLRTNYFNGFVQSGNDDWFNNGTAGTGQFVIDTNGAAAMMNLYTINPAARKLPFYRTMRVPQYSLVNNRLWIDAVMIRDYNGQAGGDSTAFVISNKNGDSPASWDGGVTSVLDKDDISDMMIHVRRAGPTKFDSLWFMGGISIQGTNGNRYFDFELYQTDIFYSRTTGKFSNYGPDEGHTSWKFDASGNIIAPGDVIFSAEYSSSSLTLIEARIWVSRNDWLTVLPTGFDWVGAFDGGSMSSLYGYANIRPKTAGNFYTGLQSNNNTWAGPFGFIDGGNNLLTTYTARQFMEFSVNLTKLGLDPITLLGGSACGLPFRRILVKTRSSTSFTASLKDFIGPFDFFTAQPVQIATDVPLYCGQMGVSDIWVTNPASASVYTWSTLDGHIVSSNVGTNITVDTPGTYVVIQQLLDGCSSFASDTVTIVFDSTCVPMETALVSFRGDIRSDLAELNWVTSSNKQVEYFELQRSENGKDFQTMQQLKPIYSDLAEQPYFTEDWVGNLKSPFVFYRVKVKSTTGVVLYSSILRLSLPQNQKEILLFPNPVADNLQLSVPSDRRRDAVITIVDISGHVLRTTKYALKEGSNMVQIDASNWRAGTYLVNIDTGTQTTWKKFMVNRTITNK